MALSHIAQLLAHEIGSQDWSDAHSRLDGARHDRTVDRTTSDQLDDDEAQAIKMNVVWVVAQALYRADPNFEVREFAEQARVSSDFLFTRRGLTNGMIEAGLRRVDSDITLTPENGGWAARRVAARPDGQLAVVHAATAERALEILLAG